MFIHVFSINWTATHLKSKGNHGMSQEKFKKTVYGIDTERGWKTCIKCHNNLLLSNFYIDKRRNTYTGICKKCDSIKNEIWRKDNIERHRQRNNKYQRERRKNPEIRRQETERHRQYVIENRDKIRAWEREYRTNKVKNNIHFKIKRILSSSIHRMLNGCMKKDTTQKLIGCDIKFFIQHIESQFRDGMNWNNIHIHHVVPCKLFDLSQESHQRACFHYSNLSPLFAIDNIKQSDYLPNGVRSRDLTPEQKEKELIKLGFAYLFN